MSGIDNGESRPHPCRFNPIPLSFVIGGESLEVNDKGPFPPFLRSCRDGKCEDSLIHHLFLSY